MENKRKMEEHNCPKEFSIQSKNVHNSNSIMNSSVELVSSSATNNHSNNTNSISTDSNATAEIKNSRPRRTDVIRIGLPGSPSIEEQDLQDNSRCKNIIETLYVQSPMVLYLLEALKKSSCLFNKQHFHCVPCDKPTTGFFDPIKGISICQNFVASKKQVEETLSHELIHAFDYCTREFDPNNCTQIACSEIRAAALSGDCRWMNEFMRGHYSIKNQYQACVKRRAVMSIQDLPCCTGQNPSKIVDKILNTCMKDTRPFIDIPY